MSQQPFEWPSYTQTIHRTSYPAIEPTNPLNSAAGKVVVVTGGGTGIGKAIAGAFIRAGAKAVAILGRRSNVLAEARAALEQQAASSSSETKTMVLTFQADVLDAATLDAAFAATAQQAGPIDVAVANAGYLPTPGLAVTADIDDYFRAFEINVKGTFLTFRAFNTHMRKSSSDGVTIAGADASQQPVFIALNTAAATLVMPQLSGYTASKLAQLHLVTHLAAEHEGAARVVQFHPGVLATDMLDKAPMITASRDDVSLPAAFAVWLASPAAAGWTDGLFLWAHWDVDELRALRKQIRDEGHLRAAISGFPQVLTPTLADS